MLPILPKTASTRNYAEVRAYKMLENTTADGKSQFKKLAALQPVLKVCNPHVSRSTLPAQVEQNSPILSTKAVAYDRQPTGGECSETEYNSPISSTRAAACDRQLKWGDYSEAELLSICQADNGEATPTSYQDPSDNQGDQQASKFIKRSIRKKHERRERKSIVHARDRDFHSLCDLHYHIVSLQATMSQHTAQLQSLLAESQRCRILHDSSTSRQDIIDKESLDFEYNFVTMMYCERSLIKLPNNT